MLTRELLRLKGIQCEGLRRSSFSRSPQGALPRPCGLRCVWRRDLDVVPQDVVDGFGGSVQMKVVVPRPRVGHGSVLSFPRVPIRKHFERCGYHRRIENPQNQAILLSGQRAGPSESAYRWPLWTTKVPIADTSAGRGSPEGGWWTARGAAWLESGGEGAAEDEGEYCGGTDAQTQGTHRFDSLFQLPYIEVLLRLPWSHLQWIAGGFAERWNPWKFSLTR